MQPKLISSLLGRTKGGKADDEHSGGSLLKMFEIHSISFVVPQSFVLALIVSAQDWLPTLYRAAGGNPSDLGGIDGMDMWHALLSNRHNNNYNKSMKISTCLLVFEYFQGLTEELNASQH